MEQSKLQRRLHRPATVPACTITTITTRTNPTISTCPNTTISTCPNTTITPGPFAFPSTTAAPRPTAQVAQQEAQHR